VIAKIVAKRFKKLLISLRKPEHYIMPRAIIFRRFLGLVDNESEFIGNDLAKKYLDF